MIRLAHLQDLPRILEIKDLAIHDMHQNGVFSRMTLILILDILKADRLRNELYVLEEDDLVQGLFISLRDK